jgi:prepilin-type N-terminal cleavage/methylation domain-containing protein
MKANPIRSDAFSLIEVLVATAILSLLSVILLGIVDSATRLWREDARREDGFREARATLNVFSRDVRNFVPTTNTDWFFADTNRFAFLSSLPKAAQREDDQSDVCVVGYSLEWGKTDPRDAAEGYALYRYVRFSRPTFQDTLQAASQVSDVFDQVDGSSTVREVLARNVTSVAYTLFSTNSAGDLVDFVQTQTNPTPDLCELAVSTIGETHAVRLTTPDAWRKPDVKRMAQTFRLRMHMPRLVNTASLP